MEFWGESKLGLKTFSGTYRIIDDSGNNLIISLYKSYDDQDK